MMNLSLVDNDHTARTNYECAVQRAENLAVLGAKNVLELCVGPSLKTLEIAYGFQGINVTGNDIDPRWAEYHPKGKWIIGDCLKIDWSPFDAVVFAPPLSHGCTGKRIDSLMINEVTPSYHSFMTAKFRFDHTRYKGIRCMVLPARSLSTYKDRREFFSLLSHIDNAEVVPLTAGRRRIRKYVDVYYRG